jgi:methyl-accepting chemotaxis protein
MKGSFKCYVIVIAVVLVSTLSTLAVDVLSYGARIGWTYFGLRLAASLVVYGAYVTLRGKPFGLLSLKLAGFDPESEEYRKALERIGHVPLESFIHYFVFSLPLMVGSYFGAMAFGAGEHAAFVSMMVGLSLSAYLAAFIYVLLDKISLDALLAQRIHSYPTSLREPRQRRKNLIIPMFMSIMAFLVACTAVIATDSEDAAGLSPYVWAVAGVYQLGVLVLVLIWSKNTAFLYKLVIDRLEQIASSEKDLTGKVLIASIDEISSMEGLINDFNDTLQRSFAELKGTFERLGDLQTSLFSSVEESSGAAKDIAGRIDEIRSLVSREDGSVAGANDAGERLSRRVGEIVAQVEEQNVNIKNTVMSAEMGLAAISGANERAIDVRRKVDGLMASFERGGIAVGESIKSVRNVAERSKKLSEINATIAKIASQTNLLAMNAAIEAAHAGDAGAGFSVVADEIRALAEGTSQRTKDSRESLGAILADIQSALAVSSETETAYAQMREALLEVDEKTKVISESLSNQDAMNKAILDALRESILKTEETAKTAQGLIEEAKILSDTLSTLAGDARDTSSHAQEMSERNAKLLASIAKLATLSNQASELYEKTETLVSDFRV